MNNKVIFEFERAVESSISKYSMTESGNVVLAALSGGADSVSLVLSLLALSKKLNFSLCACHLNHMIRKETANRDEEFSRTLCQKLAVPFISEKKDIPSICKKGGGSIETVARNERYAFFERCAKKFGADRIATAHTKSDNAETVIFNLVRGCANDGLCGIPPKRDHFIRPLCDLSRKDVENYLFAKGQSFVTDETNSETEYSRNFIRLSVIPLLKQMNPSLEDTLLRLSENAREDKEFFALQALANQPKDHSCQSLCNMPPSLLKRYIRKLFSDACTESVQLSHQNVDDIAAALFATFSDKTERRIDLPGKMCAFVSESGVCIQKSSFADANKNFSDLDFNIPLKYGENIINEKYAVFVTGKNIVEIPDIIKKQDIVYKLYKKADCLSDIIEKDAFAKNRRENDCFVLGGMSRKLKKVYSEMHIEKDERKKIPLVCDSEKIICLPLYSYPCDTEKADGKDAGCTVAFYRS